MPNESTIVHRVVVWDTVHELEYKGDIALFGTAPALSRPRWVTLRQEALDQLGVEWFGADNHGKPLVNVTLAARAKHSNFATCLQCAKDKQVWIDFRSGKTRVNVDGTPIDARELKERLATHIRNVKAQRAAAMHLAQQCASQQCGLIPMTMPAAVVFFTCRRKCTRTQLQPAATSTDLRCRVISFRASYCA